MYKYLSPTDGSAGELVTPDKTRPQVEAEYDDGRDLYRRSHFGYLPGEQKTRNYVGSNFSKVDLLWRQCVLAMCAFYVIKATSVRLCFCIKAPTAV